jgi:peptidoglycan/LPS O-acetylase OafA/YrhL
LAVESVPRPPADPAPSPALAPPPGNPRFALFDSLRALAVLAVVVFHVTLVSGALSSPVTGDGALVLGTAGPILFFAISGFLLYRPWVAARTHTAPAPSVGRYGRRRALRILPAYWFALLVMGVFPGLVGVFGDDWWRYFFFLQLYDDDTLGAGIPVAWTLCVEVSFYVLLPLWAAALRRARPGADLVALAVLAVAGAAVQVAGARLAISRELAQSLAGQCTWMAIGMALAVVSVSGHRSPVLRAAIPRPGLCWLGAAVAFAGLTALRLDTGGVLGIVASLQTAEPVWRAVAEIVLMAAMIALVMVPAVFDERGGGLPRRLLALPAFVWLGVVSYGVYLWHLPIAELLGLRSVPGHFSAHGLDLAAKLHVVPTPILFVLTLAISCGVAWASYRFVELPFLRRKDR